MNVTNLRTITKLIKEELNNANKKFPQFQSKHEAYAIMKEELEEVIEELNQLSKGVLNDYWSLCRNSKQDNEVKTTKTLAVLSLKCLNSIHELIQVGAMIEKAKIFEENNK